MTVHILKPDGQRKRWVRHQRLEVPQVSHKVLYAIFSSLFPGNFLFMVSVKGEAGWQGLREK